MNTIAAQIDYATDELAALNRLLVARENHRRLADAVALTKPGVFRSVANEMAINALAHVLKLEREYKDTFGPADAFTPPVDAEPLPDCGERFPPRQRVGTMHPDDPRRGQADSINRANRGV